jgi:hypothetical protein
MLQHSWKVCTADKTMLWTTKLSWYRFILGREGRPGLGVSRRGIPMPISTNPVNRSEFDRACEGPVHIFGAVFGFSHVQRIGIMRREARDAVTG